jgi:hypothetical protein
MELLTKELILELLDVDQAPCLSVYMPTHRKHPDNLKDAIVFKNLVKDMKESLLQKYSSGEVIKHLEPFETLAEDHETWNNTFNGLAVFSAKDVFKVVGVHTSFEKLAIVADSFHTKPLWKYLQSLDHYHVLGVTLQDIQLFEGHRHTLTEIELHDDTPTTITEALGDELTEGHLTAASYGGAGANVTGMHHGHGGRKDEAEIDAEKFFRVIANEIHEKYSKPSGWPLILVALTEHQSVFRKVNKNSLLIADGIEVNPSSVTIDKLAEMAWEVMEPEYTDKLVGLGSLFEQARADRKGSDDYKEVALAAVEGRIDTLLVEADRIIPVRITNLVTGNTQKKDMTNPRVDDLLDDMGELVLKMGGEVMVLPKENMPSETGLAAIFRY